MKKTAHHHFPSGVGILSLLLILFLQTGCGSPEPLPRPKGWPRIDLPEHTYTRWTNALCPFSFELPATAIVESEKTDSCWVNFYFKAFECRWHLTYKPIGGTGKTFDDHSEEYRKLVYKHSQQAQIQPSLISGPAGRGTFYELYGNVGVPAQFCFGDSSHIIMTSFYFDTAINQDSLDPVVKFLKKDLLHLIETIEFRD